VTKNRVQRYTQPCVQIQPGPKFRMAEVPLFEDPKGKWVKYEDVKHLLRQDEPTCSTFDQYPVGTLFQKKADGRLLAMTPNGETVMTREPEKSSGCTDCGGLLAIRATRVDQIARDCESQMTREYTMNIWERFKQPLAREILRILLGAIIVMGALFLIALGGGIPRFGG